MDRKFNYNIDEQKVLFENIKRLFKDFDVSKKIDTKQKIIFILGMPRSGTTLMEQIITTDKNISGGGEMDVLPNLVGKYFAKDRIKGELGDINEILKQNDINKIFTENGMAFESKVFEGHDHDPNDFGKRFTPSLNYLTKK